MFIIRRVGVAKPGRRDETIGVIREFYAVMEKNLGRSLEPRIVTGSIGVSDSVIETEIRVESLAEFEESLKQSNAMPELGGFMQKMSELMVPGSNRFEIYRLQS